MSNSLDPDQDVRQIWVKTVSKDYQQMTLTGKDLSQVLAKHEFLCIFGIFLSKSVVNDGCWLTSVSILKLISIAGVSTILSRLSDDELRDGMKKLCSFQVNPLSKVSEI